jgi:hypothetical protein
LRRDFREPNQDLLVGFFVGKHCHYHHLGGNLVYMNKAIYLTLISLVFSLPWMACTKPVGPFDGNCTGDCFTLKGKAVEQQTNAPIEGLVLRYYFDQPSGGLGGPGKINFIGSSVTAPDGSYQFRFPQKEMKGYRGIIRIEGEKEDYVNRKANKDNILSSFRLDDYDSVSINDLDLWKASPLQIRVVATSNLNFDRFYFTQVFDRALNYNNQIRGNRAFDTTFYLLTGSDIKTYINWATDGSSAISGRDSIIVAGGTTGFLRINL